MCYFQANDESAAQYYILSRKIKWAVRISNSDTRGYISGEQQSLQQSITVNLFEDWNETVQYVGTKVFEGDFGLR